MAARSFVLTSNLTAQPVANYDVDAPFNHVSVTNNTDGNVEVYFGSERVNLIVAQGFVIAFDGFTAKGQAYVRNISGSGGEVVLVLWASEGH